MKNRILRLAALVAALIALLFSCTRPVTEENLYQASSVEITAHGGKDSASEIQIMSDERAVLNLANTFSLLSVKRGKIDDSIKKSYTVRFLDEDGGVIEVFSLYEGSNVIKCGEKVYRITEDGDLNYHIREEVLNVDKG